MTVGYGERDMAPTGGADIDVMLLQLEFERHFEPTICCILVSNLPRSSHIICSNAVPQSGLFRVED